MKMLASTFFKACVFFFLGLFRSSNSLAAHKTRVVDRRRLLLSGGCAIGTIVSSSRIVVAEDSVESSERLFNYEDRKRGGNKEALLRDDYWFMTGKKPPRKLAAALGASFDDPKYNAWGSCETSEITGNSCLYVSLKQKIPAYSKYAFNLKLGTREFSELGDELQKASAWESEKALSLLSSTSSGSPCPAEDALLKAALLGTGLLTSPNYTGPAKELLVARFYVNEAAFAMREIRDALSAHDAKRARGAWEFGRDSWNSYFTVVNRAIVPKVGERFEVIA